MILTVTLNPAVDKTYIVDDFAIDRVHRPSSSMLVPGGKGINVARVYQELGGQAIATGFAGGHNGDYIMDGLRDEGVAFDFVHTAGESRVCIAVVDHAQKTQTELNEVGPPVQPDEVERFKLKYESLVQGMEYTIISGSVPPGVPDTIYRELIEIASHHGVRCVLDASGSQLSEGIKAAPFMVKPNVHELSAILGRQLGTIEETAEAARAFLESGIEIMLVSFGRDGALVASKDGILWARPPEIKFISAVGSGDSLAAAFVHVLENGGSVCDALKLGTGAGAANAATFGAGLCKREDILSLASKVECSVVG